MTTALAECFWCLYKHVYSLIYHYWIRFYRIHFLINELTSNKGRKISLSFYGVKNKCVTLCQHVFWQCCQSLAVHFRNPPHEELNSWSANNASVVSIPSRTFNSTHLADVGPVAFAYWVTSFDFFVAVVFVFGLCQFSWWPPTTCPYKKPPTTMIPKWMLVVQGRGFHVMLHLSLFYRLLVLHSSVLLILYICIHILMLQLWVHIVNTFVCSRIAVTVLCECFYFL